MIRSQYLRAYRYCDQQFLKDEEKGIRQSFLALGYPSKFIEECRASAYKGRKHEVQKEHLLAFSELPFAINIETTKTGKSEPLATLPLVYLPHTEKLQPRLHEMGIRLAFSTNSTLRQQLQHNSTCDQPKGSVYVVNCSACPKVYVGQTGNIQKTECWNTLEVQMEIFIITRIPIKDTSWISRTQLMFSFQIAIILETPWRQL